MSSSPRRKRYNTLSPSFEKEFRFVKDVVVSIKHQTKKYLGTETAFTEDECLKCATFIQETCSQLNFVANEILTYNEFVELILKNHRQRILCIQTDSYHVLNKIQKWQQQFQLDINQCYDRLLLCLNDHVYIVSDRDPWRDLPGANLEGVADFDQKMKAFRADISSKMDALKERPSQNNEGTPEPLQKQVEGFGSYKNSARETCTLLHSVCDATLEWMRAEGRYPEVLWQQITSNNSVKEDLVRQLSELRQKRSQLVGALGKKRKVREQMERTFAFQNKERRKMKNNREMIEFVILNLEQKLESKNENKTENTTKNSSQEKHQKGEDVKRKINERSKRSSNNHCNESGYHLRQLQVMRNQYTRIRKEQRILYISNYELKVFISQKNHQLQELQRQVDEVDVLINNVSNELTKLNVQTETLRKMRDDRLSPGVFKKITSQNNKGPKNKANVEDACCFVSKHIGRHWKKLYENLPFNPARSASRRTTDIELWDKMSLTQDRTDEELAGRSLAKWRVINRPCSVGQLVWALRKIDQQELAEKVKKKFWTSNKGNNNNNNNNNNNGNNNNNNGNNNNGNNNNNNNNGNNNNNNKNGNNNNNNNNNGNNNNTAANNNNSKTNNNNTISTNSNNTTTTNNSCTTKNNNNSNTTTTTDNTTTTTNVNSNTTTAITTNNNSNSTTDSNTTTDNNIGNTTNNNSNTTTTATTNKNSNTTTTNENSNATTDNNTATTTNDNSNTITTTNNSNTTNNKNSSNTTTTTNENSKINSNDSLENSFT